MHPCIRLALALSFIASIALAQEGYPLGTLVPEVDLGLQPVAVKVPEPFRGEVPEDLMLNLPASAAVPPGFVAIPASRAYLGGDAAAISADMEPDQSRDEGAAQGVKGANHLFDSLFEGGAGEAKKHQKTT